MSFIFLISQKNLIFFKIHVYEAILISTSLSCFGIISILFKTVGLRSNGCPMRTNIIKHATVHLTELTSWAFENPECKYQHAELHFKIKPDRTGRQNELLPIYKYILLPITEFWWSYVEQYKNYINCRAMVASGRRRMFQQSTRTMPLPALPTVKWNCRRLITLVNVARVRLIIHLCDHYWREQLF